MMEEKFLIPKRRFKRYTEEWLGDKLENLLELLKDGTHGTHKNVDKGVYLLSAKNIKHGEIQISEEDRIISIEEYKKIHKYFSLKKGDVLLTIVGSIGESAIIDDPNGYTFQRSVAYLRPEKEINSEFLYAKINSQVFQEKLVSRQVLSAQAGIYLRDLSDIFILFPNIQEQQKIGEFFKVLDERIANQERKIAKVKALKTAYLTEMFPQEGETVPKRRFKEFQGEWKDILLEEALDYEQPNSYIVDEEDYSDKFTTPVLTAGQSFLLGFTQETHGIKNASLDNPVVIFDDFTTSSHFVDFSFKVKSSALKILIPDKNEYNSYFLYQVLKNIDYKPQNHERHWISIFSSFTVKVPTKSEQQKIGQFFKNLDDQISTKEKKLKKLKKMKEAYLEEMFV